MKAGIPTKLLMLALFSPWSAWAGGPITMSIGPLPATLRFRSLSHYDRETGIESEDGFQIDSVKVRLRCQITDQNFHVTKSNLRSNGGLRSVEDEKAAQTFFYAEKKTLFVSAPSLDVNIQLGESEKLAGCYYEIIPRIQILVDGNSVVYSGPAWGSNVPTYIFKTGILGSKHLREDIMEYFNELNPRLLCSDQKQNCVFRK